MSDPYIGEIRIFAGNFAPSGWAFCQGQLISISGNEALFSLIGTTYGGDGQSTFGLPDLRGRIPLGQGQGPGLVNRTIGEASGVEKLTAAQLPTHTHTLQAMTAAAAGSPTGNLFGAGENMYAPAFDTPTAMAPPAIGGGNPTPTERLPPHQGLNYIISLYGIYPSPS